jgi:hypothetical protein
VRSVSIAIWCALLAGTVWADRLPVSTPAPPNIELTVTLHGEAKIQSNEKAEFSLHLDKGIYAAVFHRLYFKSRVVVFEITERGEKELRATLEIGTVD